MFSCCSVKVMQDFSLIIDLAVTARATSATRNYSRADVFFFSEVSVKQNKVLSLPLDVKITFISQCARSSVIVHLSLILKQLKFC